MIDLACKKPEVTGASDPADPLEPLRAYADEHDLELVVDGTVMSLDGERWFQQMRFVGEARLSHRYGLDQDGHLLPLSVARAAWEDYHREQFGALGVDSAGRWLRG